MAMADEGHEEIKYRRIWRELRQDIQAGRWKVGERIPSELELSDTYGVSRGTVRNAIAKLVNDQMLRLGTTVSACAPFGAREPPEQSEV